MKTLNLFLAVCFFATAGAQNLVRVFGNPNQSYLTAQSAFVNSNQEIVTVGCTSPTQDRFSGNALIVKTDFSGNVLWNKEHIYNNGTSDVMSNYISVVEDGGSTGSVQYVAVGSAINKQGNFVFAMINPATGAVTNSQIINPTFFQPWGIADSAEECIPIKLLYDNIHDQFICVFTVKRIFTLAAGGGLRYVRMGLMLLDNNLNHLQTLVYAYPSWDTKELVRPIDAALNFNAISNRNEIAIIGTIYDLPTLNTTASPTTINPDYDHPAPFLARIELPQIGGPISTTLDMHIYPYLYNPGVIEEALNTSFTTFEKGNVKGFYIAAFRAIAIGQSEPFVYEVDDNGVLQNTFSFSSPPPSVANKHEMITSVHYNRSLNELIMTGGRYESVFNNILIDFNEFWKVALFQRVYAKSWYLDLDVPSIKSWNYGNINAFDSTSWITSSIYDENTKMIASYGNFKPQFTNEAKGFQFVDNISHEMGCYEEIDDIDFNDVNLFDTILSFEGYALIYDSSLTHSVSDFLLDYAIDCEASTSLFKESPFDHVANNTYKEEMMIDEEIKIRVYDLSGRLLINTSLAIGNLQQAEAFIRKALLKAYPDLLRDKVYIVQYQLNSQAGRFKLVITD